MRELRGRPFNVALLRSFHRLGLKGDEGRIEMVIYYIGTDHQEAMNGGSGQLQAAPEARILTLQPRRG